MITQKSEQLIDRFWLLTWTTYGTWLPGDERGFVSSVDVGGSKQAKHNVPGTTFDTDLPGLCASANRLLKSPVVLLNIHEASLVAGQVRDTCRFRDWQPFAIAVMANHVHVVVGVRNDPDPATILRDLKSYSSRTLNQKSDRRMTRWWTESGSRRKLPDESALAAAMRYVRDQSNPLAMWVHETSA